MTVTTRTVTSAGAGTVPFSRTAAWLLPAYTALLAMSTLTHQPDPGEAFEDYVRYVTTPLFLVSHLGASIGGAALGALGVLAVAALLIPGPAGRVGVVGAATFVAGNVVTSAVFGAAAFAQPAIGRAQQAGATGIAALDRDVYGPALVGTAVVGLLLLLTGAVVLARAVAHARPDLRIAAVAFGGGLAMFVVTGFVIEPLQPVAALVATTGAVLVVRGLRGEKS